MDADNIDAALISRDELHDSIDPHTGVLSAAASARRTEIIDAVHAHQREAGVEEAKLTAGWPEALAYWEANLADGAAAEAANEEAPAGTKLFT